jgi:hypothetical protein
LPRLAPVIRLIFSGDLGAFGQCVGYGLGFAGAGEAAHADGHAVLDQSGGVGRALSNNEGKRIRSRYMDCYLGIRKQDAQSSDFEGCRPATMVE